MHSKYAQCRQCGVTLIELMIVVVIVGVLGTFAITNYSAYLKKGYRIDAQAKIMEVVMFMQRYYSTNDSYYKVGSTDAPDLPVSLRMSPADGGAVRYQISVLPTATGFTVRAIPVSGGAMDGDECGVMAITNMGARSVSSGTVSECWRS